MSIPTEPVGTIPRPPYLQAGLTGFATGAVTADQLEVLVDRAVRETVERLEELGSPVVTDGGQGGLGLATYPLAGDRGGLPVLTGGRFRYAGYADRSLRRIRRVTGTPVKQTVVAPSTLSTLYPSEGVAGYSREAFLLDLLDEGENDIRRCFEAGAEAVQIDFTDGRLATALDPTGALLRHLTTIDNQVLGRFSAAERRRIGVRPTHGGGESCDDLLPALFGIDAGNFYLRPSAGGDRRSTLRTIADRAPADARIFIGVTDPLDPRVESSRQVRDRVLEAAEFIVPDRLGTCDDCGFPLVADDLASSRRTAFAKVAARVEGTVMAADVLGM